MSDSPTFAKWLRDELDSLDWSFHPDTERVLTLDLCEVCGNGSTVVVTVEEYSRLLDVNHTSINARQFHRDLHDALPDRDTAFVHLMFDAVHEHCREAVRNH